MQAADFFTLPPSLQLFAAFFRPELAPWEWVRAIGPALASLAVPSPARPTLPPGIHGEGPLWLHPSVKLPGYATLHGPSWIGPGVEIRPGAYVRGNVIVGSGGVLGNACEFKNCLLLDDVQVPHFSYVGDSVLGNRAHLGAGAICSNLRLDQQPVVLRLPDGRTFETGMRKLGSLLGDQAEAGCNSVLNPGTLLGRRACVLPGVSFAGFLPAATLARTRQPITLSARRD